jgi:flagellar biogenesis protein FliO
VKALLARLALWVARRRSSRVLKLVDQLPLQAGAAVHVIDVDDRRLVVATTSRSVRLLTLYDRPNRRHAWEEGA